MSRWLCLPVLTLLLLPVTSRAAEPDKYLLDDTDGILTLNIRQIVDSGLFKKNYQALVQKLLRSDADLQGQLKEMGLDPLKDIDRILIVHGESCHRLDEKNPGGMVFILRGRFDSAKMNAKATALAKSAPKMMKADKTAGGTIYELSLPGQQSFFIAMPDKTTVMVSPFKDHIVDALDKGAGKKKTQLKNQDVQSLLSSADAKQSFWLLATGRMAYGIAKGKKLTLGDAGVVDASGGITIGDEVKSSFVVNLRDEKSAKDAAGSLQMDLNEVLEAAFNAAGKDKRMDPLREFLRTLAITAKEKQITLEGEVAGKVFEDSLK